MTLKVQSRPPTFNAALVITLLLSSYGIPFADLGPRTSDTGIQWSDPIPIAETTVAAAPAVVAVENAIHIFWLNHPQGAPPATGEVWHAARSARGDNLVASHRIAANADTRLAWPAAARLGSRLYVAWMERTAGGVRLRVAIVGADGNLQRLVSPTSSVAEEGGRIAVLESGSRIHIAWSQFADGNRWIWYARLTPDGTLDLAAHALADGDAPALVGEETPELLWWRPTGPGNYTLAMGEIENGRLERVSDLTGQVLLVNPLPPIPLSAPGGIDILVPTIEQAFRTASRLYLVRVMGSAVTARLPLSGGRAMSDVTGADADRGKFVMWAEAAGRRQNSEIFAAHLEPPVGRLDRVARTTYTPAGSLRPSVAVVGGAPVAVWLETLDITRFQLVMGTSLVPRPRAFLLDTPELDLFRPGRFLSFSALVIVGVLPYAALLAGVFVLVALGIVGLAGVVFGEFAWWQQLQRRRPVQRMTAILALVLLVELPVRLLIPGNPGTTFLAVALAVPLVLAVAVLSRLRAGTGMLFLAAVGIVLLVQMTAVLFPWGATQLTQF